MFILYICIYVLMPLKTDSIKLTFKVINCTIELKFYITIRLGSTMNVKKLGEDVC